LNYRNEIVSSPASGAPSAIALIVVGHRDVRRIGERALLTDLSGGQPVALSRVAPAFALPGTTAAAPLGDGGIGLQPLWLLDDGAGGVHLHADPVRVPFAIEGQPGKGREHLRREHVDHGVMIALGGCTTLMLRRVELPQLRQDHHGMIGHSDAVERLRRDVVQVARVDVPVLIRGETGSGKERVARAIHAASERANKPFIAVNMAAISPTAAASELFGHRRGSFTGAVAHHPGFFGSADGGTLFLDEIAETPLAVQTLLLRALDEGEVQPVGGLPHKVNVRLIAATDADLEHEVDIGRFRDAMLHRIQAFTIDVPPLRRRREDISTLLVHFLREQLRLLGAETNLEPRGDDRPPWLTPQVVQELMAYDWPGNVRQLRNIAMEVAVRSRATETAAVPPSLHRTPGRRRRMQSGDHAPQRGGDHGPTAAPDPMPGGPSADLHVHSLANKDWVEGAAQVPAPVRMLPAQLPDATIVAVLRDHRWNITASARALGIAKNSLVARMADIDGVRRAGELTPSDIDDARAEVGASPRAMAMLLHVSERGLRLRLRELQDLRCGGKNDATCSEVCTGLDDLDGACRAPADGGLTE